MRDECDENPAVNSTPQGLKYSAGHNHDDDQPQSAAPVQVPVPSAYEQQRLAKIAANQAKLASLGLTGAAALPSTAQAPAKKLPAWFDDRDYRERQCAAVDDVEEPAPALVWNGLHSRLL